MGPLAYIAPWVLGSVCVGLVAGFYLGRGRNKHHEDDETQRERQAVLKVLIELIHSADQINSNVETHNTEIRENAQHVQHLVVAGEMESVKRVLLSHMTTLLESNKTLQEDLVCTRYRLEEQAQVIDHVRREARTDELTTVANRKAFNEKLHVMLDDRRRIGDPFVLMMIDLDNFKRINDAHGHLVGDRVLASVGQCLKEELREGDFVGRFGGDEFSILLPNTQLDVGLLLAENLRTRTAENASLADQSSGQIAVSLSIGVVAARPNDTAESILQRADDALYRSKKCGRNQVQAENHAADHLDEVLA